MTMITSCCVVIGAVAITVLLIVVAIIYDIGKKPKKVEKKVIQPNCCDCDFRSFRKPWRLFSEWIVNELNEDRFTVDMVKYLFGNAVVDHNLMVQLEYLSQKVEAIMLEEHVGFRHCQVGERDKWIQEHYMDILLFLGRLKDIISEAYDDRGVIFELWGEDQKYLFDRAIRPRCGEFQFTFYVESLDRKTRKLIHVADIKEVVNEY